MDNYAKHNSGLGQNLDDEDLKRELGAKYAEYK